MRLTGHARTKRARGAIQARARGADVALAAAMLAINPAARATTFEWIQPARGSFHDAANWSPRGGPPSPQDAALFDLGARIPHVVSLLIDEAVGGVTVRDDAVALDLGTHSLFMWGNPSVRLGDAGGADALLEVFDGSIGTDGSTVVGEAVGASGQLTIAPGTQWINAAGTYVGLNGSGTIHVSGGEYQTKWAIAPFAASAVGLIDVEGGTFTCTGSGGALGIGGQGEGTLQVRAGGTVANEWTDIAGPGGIGQALVTGRGSQWIASRFINVGFYGSGSLRIEEGGFVSADSMIVGDQVIATGSAQVTGAGSRLHLENIDDPASGSFLTVGRFGAGQLVIADGGQVAVVAQAGAAAPGLVSIGDQPSPFDNALIVEAGSLEASGPLQVGTKPGTAGILSISQGGAVISSRAGVADAPAGIIGRDGQGEAFITCDPSLWTCADGSLDIGSNPGSSGSLTVSHGAGVHSAGGFIGRSRGSTGAALVYGIGDCGNGPVSSHWTSSAAIMIGTEGSGTLTVGSGAVVTAPVFEIGSNGTVTGNSTLAGDVVNAGLVAPGLPIGSLAVEGSYVQAPTGRLALDIGGFEPGQHDSLVGDFGVIDLAGSLEVALVNGNSPDGGEEIIIIAGGFMLNNFDEVSCPVPVQVTPNETFAVLRFIPGSEFADLTSDGMVNGADLGQLLLAFGPCPPPAPPTKGPPTGRSIRDDCTSDFNDDGVVDGADLGMLLLAWTP